MSAPTQKPLLDTGASHCFLPYSTLSKDDAEKAKIHFRVASGRPLRALMYQGVIYANSVERSLLSVGQLRDVLGLHFVWEDIHPVLLYPSFEDRKRYLLIQSFVEHNLHLITVDQMDMLVGALNLAIEDRSGWTRNTTWKLTALLLTTLSSTLSPLLPAQMSSIQLPPSPLTNRATRAAIGSVTASPNLEAFASTPLVFLPQKKNITKCNS